MRRLSAHELERALAFKLTVTARGCEAHDNPLDCELPVQACHLIPKHSLRIRGYEAEIVYDVRNGIGACYKAHRRSDGAVERFSPELIHDEAWEFAAELGLGWMLEKLYGQRAQSREAVPA